VVTDSVDARNRFAREGRAADAWTQPLEVRVTPDLRKRLDALQPDSRSAISAGGGFLEPTS
jgi:hypothetical protein